jgi:hypothetical protein
MFQTLVVSAPTRVLEVALPAMMAPTFAQDPPMPVAVLLSRLTLIAVPRSEKSSVPPPPSMLPETEAVLVVKPKTSAAEPPVRFSMPVNDVPLSSVPMLVQVRSQVLA